MRYGPDFREDHELAGGTRVHLRMIRPSDRNELRRQFDRLSPESRYRRFFAPMTELSEEMLTYLTEVDGHDHVAVVALVDAPDLKTERGIGVARFVRLGEPEVAEAAVTVVDDMQQRGVGRLLATTLVEAARERGIRRFRGEVLTTNAPMLEVLRATGATLTDTGEGTVSFDVSIESEQAWPTLVHLFREIAKSMTTVLLRVLGPWARGSEHPRVGE